MQPSEIEKMISHIDNMDDFSILSLTDMDMPPETEVNINFDIKLSEEMILQLRMIQLQLRMIQSRLDNMLTILHHY